MLDRDLAESLAAAYLDRGAYHHDLCEGACCCGVAALLTNLVETLLPGFAESATRLGLEDRPFWPEDHPELFPAGEMATSRPA